MRREVPQHWTRTTLKRCVATIDGGLWGDEPDHDGQGVRCIRAADFDRYHLRADVEGAPRRLFSSEDLSSRRLQRGDLVIEKSGGGEGQSVGCVVLFDSDEPAVCSNFCARLRVTPDCSPEFVLYLAASLYSARVPVRSIKQSTGIQNLDVGSYLSEPVALPPLDEQIAIVRALNYATATIDELSAEQERLIALLQEQRQAVISHAVTKGVEQSTQMKHSGIEWIGEIPASWRITRLKDHAVHITSGPRGWADYYAESGVPFLRITNLDRGSIDLHLHDMQHVQPPANLEAVRTLARSGDLVFSITADIGSVGVVPTELPTAFVSQHLCLVRLGADGLLAEWAAFAAISDVGKSYFARHCYGGTKVQLSLPDVANFPIPTPPPNTQMRIIGQLRERLSAISEIAAAASSAISLLRERRTALITAAVTGQIDVRGLVEPAA